MFRDGTPGVPVIAKVISGTDARRLLYYLYGPGRASEHTDPHLVAGFGDPAELEPARRPDGSPDLRRLAGLLAQPVAALCGPGYDNPVWHCSVRAAPGDRTLTDAEWADVAAEIMHTTGLATRGDEAGVRWVAVRHADDHIHIVAALARQDGTKPRTWNDFYRVREGCRDAEERLELRATPPADRTGTRRPSRAETEQAARRGWGEPPRVMLRRQVCVAAAGARSEREFFSQLTAAGVLVRKRNSTEHPGQVTGYAVGLPHHRTRDGRVIWYGGGKLAVDLSLPKLRARWGGGADQLLGSGLNPSAARAVLRNVVTSVAGQAGGEQEFFEGLRGAGVEVRLRFSEITPGQVTGYSVTLPGHTGPDGTPAWYGGGRLSAALTLPQLRRQWRLRSRDGSERRDAHMPGSGAEAPFPTAFRFTVGERDMIYKHAAHQAARAAEHVHSCARSDPGQAADAAWAAADTLHAVCPGHQESDAAVCG
jgi:hypothetical protein